ncbi:MAG: MBL fold metallo-hydrolase [Firmicutes bacterium]|nr:MBL fold metallo-hydrolase [Bacillota bacterium]
MGGTDTALGLGWLGHSSFVLQFGETQVVTDPFDQRVGYPVPKLHPDIVTVSHEHFDHNNISQMPPQAQVLRGLDPHTQDWAQIGGTYGGVRIQTFPSYHDAQKGAQRGKNAIFAFSWKGLKVAHLGDLGHVLGPDEAAALGPVDILMIPVGGYFTIDAAAAQRVVAQLRPRIAIPMHYRTSFVTNLPIAPVDEFLRGQKNVRRLASRPQALTAAQVEPGQLPEQTEIWVFPDPA